MHKKTSLARYSYFSIQNKKSFLKEQRERIKNPTWDRISDIFSLGKALNTANIRTSVSVTVHY